MNHVAMNRRCSRRLASTTGALWVLLGSVPVSGCGGSSNEAPPRERTPAASTPEVTRTPASEPGSESSGAAEVADGGSPAGSPPPRGSRPAQAQSRGSGALASSKIRSGQALVFSL